MESRKLRTIVFADITGYTSLMQNDEPEALKILNLFTNTIEHSTKNHKGELVQYYGDACLLSFESAVNAVLCAMDMQLHFLRDAVPVRIGLHLGDVVYRNNNVFGDGVNIASRIESMSIPGSILISEAVRQQIKNHPEIAVQNLGYFEFKNVDDPMEVYAIANKEFTIPDPKLITGKLKSPVKRGIGLKWIIPILMVLLSGSIGMWYFSKNNKTLTSDIPGLAVLDFTYDGDSTHLYLASGFLREINSLLTGFKKLAVTARTSSSLFDGRTENIQNIGSKLNVDYVLLGTIKSQLINNEPGSLTVLPELYGISDGKRIWS